MHSYLTQQLAQVQYLPKSQYNEQRVKTAYSLMGIFIQAYLTCRMVIFVAEIVFMFKKYKQALSSEKVMN